MPPWQLQPPCTSGDTGDGHCWDAGRLKCHLAFARLSVQHQGLLARPQAISSEPHLWPSPRCRAPREQCASRPASMPLLGGQV